MCGIVGYIGKKEAYPILIKGLQRLEYRGYDSAGVALFNEDKLSVFKRKGKVQELIDFAENENTRGCIGIGHTRWATHGEPNNTNAHPHYSNDEDLVIIHNGIIENYATIKASLVKKGHTFTSDTDTEVLVHFIGDIQQETGCDIVEAVRLALLETVGAYAIVVIDKKDPNKLVAARKSSPLVVGIGKNNEEFFIGSDATPIIEYTKNVVYLNDEEIAVITLENGLEVKTTSNEVKVPYIQKLTMELDRIEKGGYDHYMLKEIYEQAETIADCMRGRIDHEKNKISLGGIKEYRNRFINADRIIIVACGTSWHSALLGEYLIEELARVPVEVEYGSEFRYRNPIITEKDIVIAISQSGETADTLAALEIAKEKGALTYGIVNVVGSSISRVTDAGSYIHAGPEIGVASTKAFTTQITVLTLIALRLARAKGTLTSSDYRKHLIELEMIPEKVEHTLSSDSLVKSIADIYKSAQNFLYLGRNYNFPVALEGALKLKEISYIHAEGYPAAEMKHGPIALIDENMPIVVIATKKGHYEKVVSNIEEIKARKGKIIGIVTEGDTSVKNLADHVIEVPETLECLVPLLTTIPLQLLSYHIAVMLDKNVDQPRNLAKSVTVE